LNTIHIRSGADGREERQETPSLPRRRVKLGEPVQSLFVRRTGANLSAASWKQRSIMSHGASEHDDWDDEPWDEDDSEEEGEEPLISCPYCHGEIHEDAQECPLCGSYISQEDAPPARKPWWLVVGVVVCLYAIYRWIVR
jgi:hypothetical protein